MVTGFQDTKLDVLNILANVAAGSKKAVAEVRAALHGVSEWFDEYMTKEEAIGGQVREPVNRLLCNDVDWVVGFVTGTGA